MKINSRGLVWSAVAILAPIAVALLFWYQGIKVRANGQSAALGKDPVSQMVSYGQRGQYEDAINIGLRALQNQPSDEAIYQQISDIYLIRAHKEAARREEWVTKAVSYAEKAVSLNSKERDQAGVHLFQEARALEVAADLSTIRRCTYYDRARKLLEDRVPLLNEGDQLTIDGRQFPLAPLRKENDRALAGVKDKAAKAGCK